MTEQGRTRSIALAAALSPATIDDVSTIRYIHDQSLKAASIVWAADEDLEAYTSHIYAPEYADELTIAIAATRLQAGFIAGQMVATCGWSEVADETQTARLRWCHVLPMFGRMGLGRMLLRHVEQSAEAAGHTALVCRSSPAAVGFFERAGYGITAHGTRSLGNEHNFPVTFLRKNLRPPREPALF